MKRTIALAAGALIAAALTAPSPAAAEVRAGVAKVDASWHVGSSAGQYASDGSFVDHYEGTFDPTAHSVRRRPSYGMQSRLSVRALVIEGPDGKRVAVLKNDLYIPQDLVYRRAAQLMADRGSCGIGPESLTMASTHNHSSPFYSATSWGVWAFQDVFDIRFFDYMAKRMFEAVERACERLVPVRVGASVTELTGPARNALGPAIADDGTPAGYPHDNTDPDLTVIRFDDVSDPAQPKPLANLVNYSLHPEFLEGNDLISADYLGPLERMLDRRTGAITVFTQNAVGTAEPERSAHHPIEERHQYYHGDYGQAEHGARLIADAAIATWRSIERGNPEDPDRFVGFPGGGAASDFPVQMTDRWYPGPFAHPYPGVSNCRTEAALGLDPRLPIVGLPDCVPLSQALAQLGGPEIPIEDVPVDPAIMPDDLKRLGIPVPDNLSAPAYTGLQEDLNVHLQGIRLGEIFLAVCSCEQWYDQSLNIKTRTDKVADNQWNGFDWSERCEPAGDGSGSWLCVDPRDETRTLEPISDHLFRRMRAQVRNPANGWNELENILESESENPEPSEIRGNYTHDDGCGPDALTPGKGPCGPGDVSASAALGYTLTVPIAMGNDYNGYIATLREYQRGDHYRKALTGWGPRSSDYMASRLVHIGRELRDPRVATPRDIEQEELLRPKVIADLALNDARARALGEVGATAIKAFEALLPDEAGTAEAVEQPEDTERFGASFFTWNGGSNFTDNPTVRIERRTRSAEGRWRWTRYANQSGEIPVTLAFPEVGDAVPYLLGDQRWHWTAHFEAFVAPFNTGERRRATPAGRYRFTVEGRRREGGGAVPYRLVSDPFRVSAWRGITAERLRVRGDGRVELRVGPRRTYLVGGEDSRIQTVGAGEEMRSRVGPIAYPDSYESPARFIREKRTAYRHPDAPGDPRRVEWYCFTCTFRPWIDTGNARRVRVTFVREDGRRVRVAARRDGFGRWLTRRALRPGERAFVARGDVRDRWGNLNGRRSATVSRAGR